MSPKKAGRKKLYTLTEVSKRTGISMPTLQRYKKQFQSKIPSEGKGRRQRYPGEALKVFRQIKKENMAKRGRPRKRAAGKARRARRKRATKRRATKGRGKGLLTLTAISQMTGISYPTLIRYVKLHGDKIPHRGRGRRRRFPPEAVKVFRRLRRQSSRGRRPRKAGTRRAAAAVPRRLERRLEALERGQRELAKQIRLLVKALRRPLVR